MRQVMDESSTASAVVSPAARVGIGGPVGSGKTALIEALIPELQRRGVDLAVVTNDLVTKEDAERLRRYGLIDPLRVSAVEAGACPHTVIREDPTLNIAAGDDLEALGYCPTPMNDQSFLTRSASGNEKSISDQAPGPAAPGATKSL